jgi:hypothetical protein
MPSFRVTDRVGTTRLYPGIEALLDSLERGLLCADDAVLDPGRREWVKLKDHPEVVAGWQERQRYRPLDDRRSLAGLAADPLTFPHLDEHGITPGRGIAAGDDLEVRKAAWRAIRSTPPKLSTPRAADPDIYLSGERILTRSAVAGAIALVLLSCAALLFMARGMAALADR